MQYGVYYVGLCYFCFSRQMDPPLFWCGHVTSKGRAGLLRSRCRLVASDVSWSKPVTDNFLFL